MRTDEVDEAHKLLVAAARRSRERRAIKSLLICLLLFSLPLLVLLKFLRVGPLCSDGATPLLPLAGASIQLILMRHAQSENNAAWYRPLFLAKRDPMLTLKGIGQAEGAHVELEAEAASTHLVLSSQLMRAMETAALAFEQRVHVAPHISETGYGCFISPGGCALSRPEQRAKLSEAGFDTGSQFDWSLVGGVNGSNAELGKPAWPMFVRWLWAQPRVQQLVREHGENTTIAVVSHGNFLWHHVLPCGYGHPKNTQAFSARLEVPREPELAEPRLHNVRVIRTP